MDYSLAKRLKDAGFPLKTSYGIEGSHPVNAFLEDGVNYFFPTLGELIEACGSDFLALSNYAKKGWGAAALKNWRSEPHNVPHSKEVLERGSTPIEAVAKLWLALNS